MERKRWDSARERNSVSSLVVETDESGVVSDTQKKGQKDTPRMRGCAQRPGNGRDRIKKNQNSCRQKLQEMGRTRKRGRKTNSANQQDRRHEEKKSKTSQSITAKKRKKRGANRDFTESSSVRT